MAVPLAHPQHRQPWQPRDGAEGGLAAGWALLHEAGQAVAALAQLGREPMALTPSEFARRAAAGGPGRLVLIEQAIDDCAAALHSGLTALMAGAAAGRDGTAAALTLWREFDRARDALVGLATPPH